jgi:hypothetical protein
MRTQPGKNKDSRTSLRSITGLGKAIEKPNAKSVPMQHIRAGKHCGVLHKGHGVSVMVQVVHHIWVGLVAKSRGIHRMARGE